MNKGFNDGFLAELDVSDWSVAGSVITAPHNFAFDAAGNIVSVNSSFFDPGQVVTDTGTQYDGSTPLLRVQTPVTPGNHSLYLSIFDAGDHHPRLGRLRRRAAGDTGRGGVVHGGRRRARRARRRQARRQRRRWHGSGGRLQPPRPVGRRGRERKPPGGQRDGDHVLARARHVQRVRGCLRRLRRGRRRRLRRERPGHVVAGQTETCTVTNDDIAERGQPLAREGRRLRTRSRSARSSRTP